MSAKQSRMHVEKLLSDRLILSGLYLTKNELNIYTAIVDGCYNTYGVTLYAILSKVVEYDSFTTLTVRSLTTILSNLAKKKVISYEVTGGITRHYFMQKVGVGFEPTYGTKVMSYDAWHKLWEPLNIEELEKHLS